MKKISLILVSLATIGCSPEPFEEVIEQPESNALTSSSEIEMNTYEVGSPEPVKDCELKSEVEVVSFATIPFKKGMNVFSISNENIFFHHGDIITYRKSKDGIIRYTRGRFKDKKVNLQVQQDFFSYGNLDSEGVGIQKK